MIFVLTICKTGFFTHSHTNTYIMQIHTHMYEGSSKGFKPYPKRRAIDEYIIKLEKQIHISLLIPMLMRPIQIREMCNKSKILARLWTFWKTFMYHHQVTLIAQIFPESLSISLTHRSRQVFQTTSHELMKISSCWSPWPARLWIGVQGRASLMNLSLLLQQCPACFIRLTWMDFVIGGKWLHNCCFVECCFQDLFNRARSSLV